MLVIAPFVVPFTTTVAPGRSSPVSSVIVPLTVTLCCKVISPSFPFGDALANFTSNKERSRNKTKIGLKFAQ